MFSKIFKQVLRHKFITGIILILIATAGYFVYQRLAKNTEETRYITAAVEKGTLIVSVSGSGQVSSLEQIDIKPKVSGEITTLYINKDQEVKAGQLLVELDSKNAQQAVRDAEINLENANFTLEKLKKSHQEAETDLVKTYEDVFKTISDVFNDLPASMDELEEMFRESSYRGDQVDIDYYRSLVGTYTGQSFLPQEQENYFIRLRDKYDQVRREYLSITKLSPPETLENFLEKTHAIIKEIAELTRLARDIVVLYKETLNNQSLTPPISISITDGQLSDLNIITNSLDQKVSNLLSFIQTIDKCKDSITDYKRDIQSQELTIEQKEDALLNTKEELAEHFIRAPLDGIIAKINVKKGDSVSSGTIITTFITKQKIADISLNEIDAANIKVDQKVTLTFDALPELSISGKVIEVDTVGTVSQGVVSYGVKIAFDTEDEKIKPAMSVTADIITDAEQDVLVLPNSAIKPQGDSYYVELVEASEEIKQQFVEIGLSNDTSTEIVSGLKEGDIVVTSTISSTKTQTTQTQGSQQFQIPGMGGNRMMIQR